MSDTEEVRRLTVELAEAREQLARFSPIINRPRRTDGQRCAACGTLLVVEEPADVWLATHAVGCPWGIYSTHEEGDRR